ncbi:Pre-rRNA-processing protein ESF1 [Zancudomyces culisetae]|uniref:Pre-rRNA-processing protein ESF1 n=1 Tax=Zancudomyces culisetae TaxID=1213189 RepID=A0A1R1PI72_ZANCU|nr:Pre-rRNA-processing protein ESF1 [Zancudomyces culisetae]|eukprot:OMH80681.1 Pre-rRNA-processing protein ESF1 [Zancudomyces culisetae]
MERRDERFDKARRDPRFIKPNKIKHKVELDSRFAGKIEQDEFKLKVDKYGRRIEDSRTAAQLSRYYNLKKEESEKEEEEEENSEQDSESTESSSEEEDDEEKEGAAQAKSRKKRMDLARGEGLGSSSSEDEDEESEEEEEEEEAGTDMTAEVLGQDNVERSENESKRLAVVNMDWDNIRAVDIMMAFSGFVPQGGAIMRVSIYVSSFGKERMEKEKQFGPQYEQTENKEEKSKGKEREKAEEDGDGDGDGVDGIDQMKLRNVETARGIYSNCDGTEYESSGNYFDIRYVDDGEEFSEEDVKERVNEMQSYGKYRSNDKFVTKALQHSKVELTWDNTDNRRVIMMRRSNNKDEEIDEIEYKGFLASSGSEDESEDDEMTDEEENGVDGNGDKDKKKKRRDQKIEELRRLLLEGNDDNDVYNQKEFQEDEEMEISFKAGLSGATVNTENETRAGNVANGRQWKEGGW